MIDSMKLSPEEIAKKIEWVTEKIKLETKVTYFFFFCSSNFDVQLFIF